MGIDSSIVIAAVVDYIIAMVLEQQSKARLEYACVCMWYIALADKTLKVKMNIRQTTPEPITSTVK